MLFGPFEDENIFHIEKSKVYCSLGTHVKITEFLLLKQNEKQPHVWLIEAKQSSPSPLSTIAWTDYISELKEKFQNAILLFIALYENRHSDAGLSDNFTKIRLDNAQFRFVLVVHGHLLHWLPPLKDELTFKLLPLIKTLNLGPDPVIVLNDTLAFEQGLISAP